VQSILKLRGLRLYHQYLIVRKLLENITYHLDSLKSTLAAAGTSHVFPHIAYDINMLVTEPLVTSHASYNVDCIFNVVFNESGTSLQKRLV